MGNLNLINKINKADPSIGTTANIYRTGFFKAPEQTREGFLLVDVILGRKCVLPYKYQNPATGELIEIKELIGDDIFKPAFLESAEGLPFVLEHPQNQTGEFVNVTPENYKDFIKGTVVNPRIEDIEGERIVIGTLKIFDPEVIDLILSKKLSEVSQGYFCSTENSKGVYNNVPYDFEQRNIILNHLALVSEGRAGDSVRILFNGKTNKDVLQFIQNSKDGVKKMKITMNGKAVNLSDLVGKNYRINQSEKDPDEMIVEEVNMEDTVEDKPAEIVNQDPSMGMATLLMKVIEMILGKGPAMSAAGNSEFPGGEPDKEQLIGNALKMIMNLNAPSVKQNSNSLVLSEARSMIAEGIRDFEKAAINAKSILGADALNEALKFNTTDEFKKYVLVKAGRDEKEVAKMNAAQVDAYFEVEAERSKNQILNPVRNGGSIVGGPVEMVRD